MSSVQLPAACLRSAHIPDLACMAHCCVTHRTRVCASLTSSGDEAERAGRLVSESVWQVDRAAKEVAALKEEVRPGGGGSGGG
jgi:hypothetical protein